MILRWCVVLGVVGFLCGFVGPIILAPEANQGPMLGIFITGPGGAVAGAILGALVGVLKVSPRAASLSLAVAAVILAAGTLYFCIPGPHLRASVVDANIRSCVPVASLRDDVVGSLTEKAKARPVAVQWRARFDQELAMRPGVAIAVHVFRETRMFEDQARWNRGRLFAEPWHAADADQRYFASFEGDDCGDYPIGRRSLLTLTGNTAVWPPYGIAEMLGLKVADPVSDDFAEAIDAQDLR
jgi:hypothetical protein